MNNVKARAIAWGWLLVGGAGMGFAASPVTTSLTVQRIIAQADGSETREPAASAKPGDVLEYVVDFQNGGPDAARGVIATLPLPVGTELAAPATGPAPVLASVDGFKFEPLPLQRIVHAADGSTRREIVPLREYRALRWAPTDLPANGEFKVRARVRIAPNAT